jgi:two-component system, chemotaxis family, response regulator WspF
MKIGIVNDLAMAAEALRRAVTSEPEHEVVWIARDGLEAVACCARRTPDLVLMDLIMPNMDGVEATRRIMAETPCAIIVVTASVGANASRTFDAMAQGALDAVDTPLLEGGSIRVGAARLLAKIDGIGRLIGAQVRPRGRLPQTDSAPTSSQQLVAIGASAGGPGALAIVLRGLPASFSAAIVIIQHIDEKFAPGMAQWLRQHCALPVTVVAEGGRITSGEVHLACSADHLTLKTADRLGYTAEPRDYVYRPSVDVFFHGVCRLWPGEVVGVLLTGMGHDGALGLKALRDRGHHTIAQDRLTSAVYGMPKAAAEMDAAVEILPLSGIAPRLARLFASTARERGAAP